jgi:hypothetical protein
MARTSLVLLGVLASSSACIVTGSPDFSPPEKTRPQLIAVTPTTEFIRSVMETGVYQPTTLEAELLSEDGGDDLRPSLLIDYGFAGPGGNPWRVAAPVSVVPPGTLSEGPRPLSVSWTPQPGVVGFGCHTVTLMITHQVRDQNPGFWCPAEPNDYATLTWFVALCEELSTCDYSDCFIAGEDTYNYCGGGEQSDGGTQ